MEPTTNTHWERSLAQLAQRFEYPETPVIRPWPVMSGQWSVDKDRRSAVGGRRPNVGRRLAWAVLILALVAAAAFAAPQTRAALLSLFARVGAINIFIDESGPSPTTLPPTVAPPAALPYPLTTSQPTAVSAVHSLELFELGEPSTLAEARRLADFPLTWPEALGEPDEVYIHRGVELPAVTFVWRDEAGEPLSLTAIGVAEFLTKLAHGAGVRETRVGDVPAIWLEGPHRLQLLGGWPDSELLITSNVLIWVMDDVTYRLEGDLPQEEMVILAESVQLSP